MSDEWAEAITAFQEAMWKAKESGVTKQEMFDEIEDHFDDE